MYISYEYYRIFYHVARCGNLTKAAEALQNSQPNLTRAIRNLEAEIGCPLFSRTNRGMILTPEGEGLYRHIKIACTEIEAGEAAVTQSRTLERGNVFLAASEGALRCLLLPVLKGIRKSTPACIFASATTPRRRPSRRCTRRRQILRSSQRRLRSRRLSRRRSSKKFGRFRSARRPFPVCLDEASRFPSWKRIHSSRSARARPPMRSTSLFSPRRALLFNPPLKPPRLTRSSQWQKRVLASASCRRRSFVRLIMCAASNCKSPPAACRVHRETEGAAPERRREGAGADAAGGWGSEHLTQICCVKSRSSFSFL